MPKFLAHKIIYLVFGFFAGSEAMGTELRIAFPKVELVTDPHKMETGYSMAAVIQLHRGLFRYQPDGNLIPDFASDWKRSQDGLSYTIRLKSAVFSSGQLLQAVHVQASFARLFKLESSISADLAYFKGAEKFRKSGNIEDFGVKIVNDKEIIFELSKPSALFLKHLAAVDCAILPIRKYTEEVPQDERMVGLGPYKITSRQQSRVEFSKWRNDDLDTKKPPQKITFLLTEEKILDLASAGKIDSIDREVVSTKEKDSYTKSGWNEWPTEVAFERFIILSPESIDSNSRKRLYASVNQRDLAAEFGPSGLVPAFGLIPEGIPGALREGDFKPLKANAQWTKKETIKIQFVKNSIYDETIAAYLAKTWKAVGFNIELTPLSPKEVLNLAFNRKGHAIIRSRGLDYFDGYSVLAYFRSDFTDNYYYVRDPDVDSKLDRAVTEENRDRRVKMYQDIQKDILSHGTVIPLLFGSLASGLWGPKVLSVPAHPGGLHTLPFEMIEMR